MITITKPQTEKIKSQDQTIGELTPSMRTKIIKLVEEGRIEEVWGGSYICHPLENTKQHHHVNENCGQFICDCQRNRKDHKICSHIIAVKIFKRRSEDGVR